MYEAGELSTINTLLKSLPSLLKSYKNEDKQNGVMQSQQHLKQETINCTIAIGLYH